MPIKILVLVHFLTGWTGRGPAHGHPNGLGKSDVAPVSQWSDHQSLCAAKELVLINELYICDPYQTFVHILVEVEPTLFQPLEVRWRFDVHPNLITIARNVNDDHHTVHCTAITNITIIAIVHTACRYSR